MLYYKYNNVVMRIQQHKQYKGEMMNNFTIFGKFFKQKRLDLKMSLREFCRRNNLDPGNISKLERGVMAPPESTELLNKYAKMLNIEFESDDWYKFIDLASACNGQIPHDFMDDEELVEKLPLVFRTLRGQQISGEKLDELAELIRRT